ncbi:MAG: hypothetical protein V8S76_04605 [Lachnospiraceae bacterium]
MMEITRGMTDYWKKANQVTDEGLSNEYARIYNEDIATKNQSINNRPYSRVWISDIENAAEYFDADFEEFAWTNFFTKIRVRLRQTGHFAQQ